VAAGIAATVGADVAEAPVLGTTAAGVAVAAGPQALSTIPATNRKNIEIDNFLFIFFSPFLFDDHIDAIAKAGDKNNEQHDIKNFPEKSFCFFSSFHARIITIHR
jgi:hypothetical protein